LWIAPFQKLHASEFRAAPGICLESARRQDSVARWIWSFRCAAASLRIYDYDPAFAAVRERDIRECSSPGDFQLCGAQTGGCQTSAFEKSKNVPGTSRSSFIEYNPKRNYVMQWNLSVARELSSSLSVTLGYVGSRGVHQPYRVDNIAMVLPTLTSAGYLWPCGPDGTPGTTCARGFSPGGTEANPVPSSTLTRIMAGLPDLSGKLIPFTMLCRRTLQNA